MLTVIDLSYYAEKQFDSLRSLLDKYSSTLGYTNYISRKLNLTVIKHITQPDKLAVKGVKYFAFRSKNVFAFVPLITHRFIRYVNPDVVIIQGFTFPVQVIFLRFALGRKPVFILQHHGGKPLHFPRLAMQILADKFVDAYLFTSVEMADEWIQKGIISHKKKCFEFPEGSTNFTRKNKTFCKQQLNMHGNFNFLWVGRLNHNKDPFTILNAFDKYLESNASAKLYMIYNASDLLEEIERKIRNSALLKESVIMVGEVPHDELVNWYSAADFFVSGSHHEGSGFALIESMACGCIPIVSHIAPFKKMLADGKYGCLFETGNANDLLEVLNDLHKMNREKLSASIIRHFKATMSHKAIANQLVKIVYDLKK